MAKLSDQDMRDLHGYAVMLEKLAPELSKLLHRTYAVAFKHWATPSAEQKVAIYDEADAAMKAYENWLDETGREGSDDLRDAFLWGRASRSPATHTRG